MTVAVALSPESAFEAPSSLTSRFCEETLHAGDTPKGAYLSRSAVSLRARSLIDESYEPPRTTCSLTGQGAGGY
eukprot:3466870-Prymnesium_polylepis.1